MSATDLSKPDPRISPQKPASPTLPRDAYPYFLACKPEIETLLRGGHTMHRVWEAYRAASPPFPATYETFRTYCGKHGLAGLRYKEPPPTAPGPGPDSRRPPTAPRPRVDPSGSPTVWPRLTGKPREFVPRMDDD